MPVRWDGTLDDLPAGIDGAIVRGIDEGDGERALRDGDPGAAEPAGPGLSGAALKAMADIGRAHGLHVADRAGAAELEGALPADRRSSGTHAWRREDGLLFDPWLRVHERAGASILRPEPESLRITGTTAEWEEWVGMRFPEDGDVHVPRRSRAADGRRRRGRYWEPNVWMHHAL